jgi:hypothetical protein
VRWIASRTLDGFEIGGERPGRTRIAGVVLLQEQIEREPEAALGETAGAAVTARAIIGKYPGGRFARVEVLGVDGSAGERGEGTKREDKRETMRPQSLPQRKYRHHHSTITFHRARPNSVMVDPGRLECTFRAWLW